MKIEKFEDIVAWQKSKKLTLLVYAYTDECKDFSFRDQLRRAAVSIMNNIAEGFERQSDKEFSQFLFISKGSSGEVRSMLYVALERKYISKEQFKELSNLSVEISKILSGFITALRKSS